MTAIALMMTALFAVVSISCKKDTPAWLTHAKTKFVNGRFVPEVQDILPGAILGSSASTAAATKATGDYETVKFADLKGNYWDGLAGTVNSLAQMRESMELYKQTALDAFAHNAPTEKGVWQGDIKYDENGSGDTFIYVRSKYNGKNIYTKLSMYSDGANEIYYLNEANGDVMQYSYLKGDKFIYISGHAEALYMISSDIENGIKKGKGLSGYSYAGNGEKGYGLMDFRGDHRDAFFYSFGEGGLTAITKTHSARAVIDGIPYGSIWQDIRAFANIDEIYFKYKEDYDTYPAGQYPPNDPIGDVCGIKLKDGTVIEDNAELWRFRLYESARYGKDAAGGWDILKSGGISGEYIMFWAGDDMSSPSAAIPAAWASAGLRYMDGFDALYADLQSESEGYFDDFRLTDFVPVANVEIKFANIQTIFDTVLAYVQTHQEGF